MRTKTVASLQAAGAALVLVSVTPAQVVLVEPGHRLRQHVDSAAPLHPSQAQLDQVQPIGDIESITLDPRSGDLFVQLNVPAGGAPGVTTHVFRVAGGVVTPVALNTGFGISERGADMDWDPARGLLVTQDSNTLPQERVAFVVPATGATGTWSFVTTPPIFLGGTFGMDFSRGAGNSVVPPGDIVFTSDVGASGIHSVTFTGPGSVTHVPPAALPGGGDDMVIQPDGDWIWVGDFTRPITRFLPFPPHAGTPSLLDVQTMFTGAGLPFVNGSRAAVCDVTGDLYVSYSGGPGGTGIFRVDEKLGTATLILTIGMPGHTEGLQDLYVGPSTFGPGASVYFTVHDGVSIGEEVWEVTAVPCCPIKAAATPRPDPGGLNAPMSLFPWPPGNLPIIGNAGFAVAVDEPGGLCPITPGSPTVVVLAFGPGALVWPGFGCLPGTPGDIQVTLAPPPVLTAPVPWPGPGTLAIHPLPIPFSSSLCGGRLSLQGLWADPIGPSKPAVLSWALDLTVGS